MNTKKRDKIAGAIYGFAIGDAMGATTEFMSKNEIRKTYGSVTNIIGGGWLKLKPGEVTDDTQMTMCVMKSLIHTLEHEDPLGSLFMKHLREEFIEWFKSGPKDIGGQCFKGIQEMIQLKRLSASENSMALGNGSLMRAMPCAILDKPFLNQLQSRMTHNNEECTKIVNLYSRLIQNHLNDENISIKTTCLVEPSGHVRSTFNNSVYWSQKETFKEAIIGAVNHGGDADTIAAITGSIAGAKFGFKRIPKAWVKQLRPEVKMYLERFKEFVFDYLEI